jgi:predicted membrane channel-forming protein YqfA (hemolysin III family)
MGRPSLPALCYRIKGLLSRLLRKALLYLYVAMNYLFHIVNSSVTIYFVDMETSYRFSKPRSTLVHTNVDPRFYLCGSIILLCFIYHMSQFPSSVSNVVTALASLLAKLIYFGTSTFCDYVLDSGKQLPSSYCLLDHIGIILHIRGTSVLLEATDSGNNNSIFLGVTLGGVVCATYLITRLFSPSSLIPRCP